MQELFGSMAFRYSIYQRSNRKGIMRDGAAYPVGPIRFCSHSRKQSGSESRSSHYTAGVFRAGALPPSIASTPTFGGLPSKHFG